MPKAFSLARLASFWQEHLYEGRISSTSDLFNQAAKEISIDSFSFPKFRERENKSSGLSTYQKLIAGLQVTRPDATIESNPTVSIEPAAEYRTSGVMGGPDGTSPINKNFSSSFDGLLVSWQPGTTASDRATARQAFGLSLREEIYTAAMKNNAAGMLEWVNLPPGLSAEQAIAILARRPGVAYAEKNWKLEAQATSNDTYFTNGSLWGMYGDASSPANAYGSQAAEAWASGYTGSSSVYVGIIDEGYQYAHPDLANNAGTNPGETAGDGIDNDFNGYVDDVYGWDFDANNNTVYDGTGDDHGTHVAGTIGGRGNGSGVAGVNWDVKLLSAKFLGSNGGTTANAIKAVDYFTALKNKGVNIVATNNSWGGGGYSQALYDAIERANQADILFIAAAGNGGIDRVGDNNDSLASYPSNYTNSNVIAVAAITSTGSRSSFSNYGATTVDLGAPGSGIWSTVPNVSYASYSGTSMATPHVTGAAALLKSVYPAATGAQIKQALLEGTAPTSSLAGITVSGGRLDIPSSITRLGQLVGSSVPLPQVSLAAFDASASETGPDPGTFRLSRSDSNDSLEVFLQIGGTATNGSDYSSNGGELASSITFNPGQSSVDLMITPIDDQIYEGTETVILTLASGVGYSISSSASSATINIVDNDPAPVSPNFWGTPGNDTITGNAGNNLIAGVSESGNDNGKSTIDTLTGLGGKDTFVLADARRSTFYNDGNNRNQGTGDYALIKDLNSSEGDLVQLRSGSQYLIRNNGSNTELFLGNGNNTFSSNDEFIATIQGVNLATGTGVYILGTTASWTSFV